MRPEYCAKEKDDRDSQYAWFEKQKEGQEDAAALAERGASKLIQQAALYPPVWVPEEKLKDILERQRVEAQHKDYELLMKEYEIDKATFD